MLMKLLKHEFRATGRIMGPIYLVLLLTSIGANVSARGLLNSRYSIVNLLGGLLMVAFVAAIIAVFLGAFVLMVQRFYKNLLQDEGYVMLTLPVSIHQQIWSKLIVSAVWFAVTLAAVILAGCIAAFDISFLRDLFWGLRDLFREAFHLRASDFANLSAILVELLVLAFLSACTTCLQFYAALSIGHSGSSHKLALSVAAYLVIQFVIQMASGIGMIVLGELAPWKYFSSLHLEGYAAIHAGMILLIAVVVVYGVIYYALTTYFLKHKLNLE